MKLLEIFQSAFWVAEDGGFEDGEKIEAQIGGRRITAISDLRVALIRSYRQYLVIRIQPSSPRAPPVLGRARVETILCRRDDCHPLCPRHGRRLAFGRFREPIRRFSRQGRCSRFARRSIDSPSVDRAHFDSPCAQLERAIAITELTEAEERGPRGETFIVAKIGMASRTTAEKDDVEIRVLFFDLDAKNEMRPTNARVTYQWITPVRDWTDPSPKYLAATYLKRRSPVRLRYGGFVVRIYCDGKLQDERSKPEALIAALHSNAPAPSVAQTAPRVSASRASEMSVSPPSVTSTKPLASPTPAAMDTESDPGADKSLPKGIPIPGKPEFVQSPYDPKFIIDVRGFPPGTLVNDPNTNKPFRVP